MSARKLAVTLLEQTEKNEGYSNLLLDHALEESGLDPRDKRLCAALYYGVLERKLTLDFVISAYSKKPPKKLDGIVLQILRTLVTAVNKFLDIVICLRSRLFAGLLAVVIFCLRSALVCILIS